MEELPTRYLPLEVHKMEVFEEGDSGSSFRADDGGGEKPSADKLGGGVMCGFAITIVQGDFVDAVDVEHDKVISGCSFGIDAPLTWWVAELNA